MKIKLVVLGAAVAAALLSGCMSSAPEADQGYVHQNTASYQLNDYQNLISPYSRIPTGTDLQYLKLTHLMQAQDTVCVINSGDFSNGTYVVVNSGSYVQRSIADNITQHGNRTVLLNGRDAQTLQDAARSNGCNIIAATRLLTWQENNEGKPYISIRLDMFDTSSLGILNSVRFMAGANSLSDLYDESKGVIKPLIATYIHKLYQN